VELERFDPSSAARWQADGDLSPGTSTDEGRWISGRVILRAGPPALDLPSGTRRLLVRLDGAGASGALVVRDTGGAEQRLPLTPDRSGGQLGATVPAGASTLVAVTLEPQAGERLRLRALLAEVAGSHGLFGLAHRHGEEAHLRVYNLGAETERGILEIGAGPALAEFDLGAGGVARLRLPLAAIGDATAPSSLRLRWGGGMALVSVR